MSKFSHPEVVQKLREALAFAYVDAAFDNEVDVIGFEGSDASDVTFVQYSLEDNEPVARFNITFNIEDLPL